MSPLPILVLSLFVATIVACPKGRPCPPITHTCRDKEPITSASSGGPGCGIPSYVNASMFGLNKFTTGEMKLAPRKRGLDISITLRNLPRRDLVMSAWIGWTSSGSESDIPDIFKFAKTISPCSSYRAGYSSGLGSDPNTFRYVSSTRAKLNVRLNFNPTYRNEGALTSTAQVFQKDVPGIQESRLRQPPVPGNGQFVPLANNFLRVYDKKKGFEKLDGKGRPMVVHSPVKAAGLIVIAHLDRMTHGISAGVRADRYDIMYFKFADKPVGSPTGR